MLYAHYEGFCKFAWNLYLEGIKQQNLNRNQCCEPIKIFSLKKKFKQVGGNLSSKFLWEFFSTELPKMLNEDLEFAPQEYQLETKSNLKPELLKSNLEEINLFCPIIDEHEVILKRLVEMRNSIAHGEKNLIQELSEYEKYEKAAFDVMYELGLTIIESLEGQKYLK